MFRPFPARQLLFASLLGLLFMPAVSWATQITHPFNSYTSHPASLSVVGVTGNGTGLGITLTNPSYQTTGQITANPSGYVSTVTANAPSNVFTGTLDITNNDLIIHPPAQNETSALATFRAVYDMLRSGAHGGAYDGKGIMSSYINLDATQGNGALAIGVMLNDDGGGNHPDGSGNPLWGLPPTNQSNPSALGPFDGYSNLTQYDTIIKYTFIGDLFLEGSVSQTDEQLVFANLGLVPSNTSVPTQAWQSGDFFYESPGGGPVSQTDDQIAFANLAAQANYPYTLAQPSAQLGPNSAISVPEPTSIVMLSLGVLGVLLIGRRTRVVR